MIRTFALVVAFPALLVAAEVDRNLDNYAILAIKHLGLKNFTMEPPGCNVGVNCARRSQRSPCGGMSSRRAKFADGSQAVADKLCGTGDFFQTFRNIGICATPGCSMVRSPGPKDDCSSAWTPPLVGDLDGDGEPSCTDDCDIDEDDIAAICGVTLPFPACDTSRAISVTADSDCSTNDLVPGNFQCDLPLGTYGYVVVRDGGRIEFQAGTTVVCGFQAGKATRVRSAGAAKILVPGRGRVRISNSSDAGTVCDALSFVTERGPINFGKHGDYTVNVCSIGNNLRLGHGNNLKGRFVGLNIGMDVNNDGRCCGSTTTSSTTTTTLPTPGGCCECEGGPIGCVSGPTITPENCPAACAPQIGNFVGNAVCSLDTDTCLPLTTTTSTTTSTTEPVGTVTTSTSLATTSSTTSTSTTSTTTSTSTPGSTTTTTMPTPGGCCQCEGLIGCVSGPGVTSETCSNGCAPQSGIFVGNAICSVNTGSCVPLTTTTTSSTTTTTLPTPGGCCECEGGPIGCVSGPTITPENCPSACAPQSGTFVGNAICSVDTGSCTPLTTTTTSSTTTTTLPTPGGCCECEGGPIGCVSGPTITPENCPSACAPQSGTFVGNAICSVDTGSCTPLTTTTSTTTSTTEPVGTVTTSTSVATTSSTTSTSTPGSTTTSTSTPGSTTTSTSTPGSTTTSTSTPGSTTTSTTNVTTTSTSTTRPSTTTTTKHSTTTQPSTTTTTKHGTTTTTSLPGAGFTRTIGFYKNHPDITLAILNAHGPLTVCGKTISDVDIDHGHSALEAMCGTPQGDQRFQLVRQLTAAALSTAAGGAQYDPTACNAVCIDPQSTTAEITACIGSADAFNNSGDNITAPWGAPGRANPAPCELAAETECTVLNPGLCQAP